MTEQMEIKVDFSELENKFNTKIEELNKKIDESAKPKKNEGKGVIERLGDRATALLEQMHTISSSNITENWTVVIPAYTTKEIRAHLRDYVFISSEIKGKAGDTVKLISA